MVTVALERPAFSTPVEKGTPISLDASTRAGTRGMDTSPILRQSMMPEGQECGAMIEETRVYC
jgi:hypothetical protein